MSSFAIRVLTGVAVMIGGIAAAQPTWTIYRNTNTGIPGDYTHTLYIDEHDRPYIAAYIPLWEEGGMGVRDLVDPTRWHAVSNLNNPVLSSPRFNDIERSPDGKLWIASDGGLLRYDPAIGPASLTRYDRLNSPIPVNQAVDVAIESGGAVWIALWEAPTYLGGLARLDPSTGDWLTLQPNGQNAIQSVAIIPDPTGPGFGVWFWDEFNGVRVYRNGNITPAPSNGGFTPIRLSGHRVVDNLGNAWMRTDQGIARRNRNGTFTLAGLPAGITTEATCLVALKNGRAALGTAYADVFIWDGAWAQLPNWGGPTDRSHTYTFMEDSQGNLWTGGIGGAAVYTDGHWQRYRLTNSSMIGNFTHAIDFFPDGRVLLNGNFLPGIGGFNIFDGVHWVGCNDFNYGIGPPWGLPNDDVAAFAVRANGHVAVATQGWHLWDWDGTTFTNLMAPAGAHIISVEEDTLGRLWAGTYDLAGIWRIDGPQRTNFTSQNSPLPFGENEGITVDRQNPGWVYIAQPNGIAHTNGSQWQIVTREQLGLFQNSIGYYITAMDIAPDGTWWVGSGRGLYHYFPTTGQYTIYTAASAGLPSNDVHHIRIAPDSSVWLNTFDGLNFPYPGGLSHFKDGAWTHYRQGSSPLPHNQILALETRSTPSGYEVWVGTASMGLAIIAVPQPCYANCDSSTAAPLLTANDFMCFLTRFTTGTAYANCDGSTVQPVLNANDFICFIERFAVGCT